MTPSQARAARAILKLGVREVAELAQVQPNTVSRIEQDDVGPRGPQAVTVAAIRRVYEARGIQFLDGGDVSVGSGVAIKQEALEAIRAEKAEKSGVQPPLFDI